MELELFIARRFLRARPRETYLSIITIISVLGILVGVMALIVVLSVMNGFRAELTKRILGVNPHVLIFSYQGVIRDVGWVQEELSRVPDVKASCPFVYSQVMVSHRGSSSGALLYGVDPKGVGAVLNMSSMIKGRGLEDLSSREGGYPQAVVGIELAYKLGIQVGDIITLISPEGKKTPLGRAPNTKEFMVAGLFDSGMYEYDLSMVYTSLKDSQEFLGLEGVVSGIQVRALDHERADGLAANIERILGRGYWTKDWKRMNKNLFAALKLEKLTMFVILTMIVLVGSLNIISGLVMTVMEKKKAIAILKAMGASRGSISRVFLAQGLIQGIVGVLGGLGLGLGICLILKRYEFISLPKDVYPLSTLPVSVQAMDILFVSGAALILTILAAVYPALKASRQDPLSVIRYE